MSHGASVRPVDAYGTHAPVLEALARTFTIRSVLEFGAGIYSTPLFLSDAYPDLERLVTVETDPSWANHAWNDPRHDVRLYQSELQTFDDIGKEWFDLAFVDGEMRSRARTAKLIEANASMVVLHDAEERYYRTGLFGYLHVSLFDGVVPWTAVATNDETLVEAIRSINLKKREWVKAA